MMYFLLSALTDSLENKHPQVTMTHLNRVKTQIHRVVVR